MNVLGLARAIRHAYVLIAFLAVAAMSAFAAGPGTPNTLRCEYMENPVGVDTAAPRFAWVLAHSDRAEKQTAYQVLVASSAEGLSHEKGDAWDSGKISSDDSTQVNYAGRALESGREYLWKVRFWDKEGRPSNYSEPARFTTGVLRESEWKASWMGGRTAGDNEFRKEFSIEGKVARAHIYVAALGYYELRVNGKKVGSKVLDPGWTTYPKRVLYSTFDVAPYLKDGLNAIAVMVGGGWATQDVDGSEIYYKQPAVLLQMDAALEDGKTLSVVSDGSWKAKTGPVVESSVYGGEVYDARRETPGWDAPGFADRDWSTAQVVEGSKGQRSSEMMPAIEVTDEIIPVKMISPAAGVYVFDMGQNLSGWARLHVEGPAGTRITLRYAEEVSENGMINRENIRTAKSRDIYILRGAGEEESYNARFTYHGFRYVEVTGFPGTPSLDSLRAQFVHTAVKTIGSFSASTQVLNDIQRVIRWSQLTNLMGVPTDCDQRDERQGWMGDAHATAEEAMLNFDMAAFYTNFIRDIADAQGEDGVVTATVPRKYGDYPADLGWETAYPLLVRYMWEQYGDRRIIEQNEAGLKKYIDFLKSKSENDVFTAKVGHEGDWVELEHTPTEYMADFWFYYDVLTMADLERALGHTAQADDYAAQSVKIRDAFNRTFFHPETGQYANGTQAANAMALFLDLVPKEKRDKVADNLGNDVLYFHNTHVTTGFLGVKFLMPALTATGRADLAYDLAAQTTYPSWGYMISRGATTLWELWQDKTGPSMNSHDHIMFGSVGAWFYQALAGINQTKDSVGYRHVLIQPQAAHGLTWASGTTKTIRGVVTSSWSRTTDGLTLTVSVPVGADARIKVPRSEELTRITVEESGRSIWSDGHFVAGDPGVDSGASEDGFITFQVGSGDYVFHLRGE